MLLALERYELRIVYKPGKELFIADALSRNYLEETKETLVQELEVNEVYLTAHLPISAEKYQEVQKATADDVSSLPASKRGGRGSRTDRAVFSHSNGRRLKTSLPTPASLLKSRASDDVQRILKKQKEKQMQYYDKRTRKELQPIQPGETVQMKHGEKWNDQRCDVKYSNTEEPSVSRDKARATAKNAVGQSSHDIIDSQHNLVITRSGRASKPPESLITDIDECSEGNFSGCPGASCINAQGSYNCQCKNGYAWDGKQECLGMKSPKELCF
ncbi:poly [Paramuricea clavata]|uniref:Poly, partial n=1 Tax=Paramuricea clavata TaxID=317549 RepID=A0A7D9I8K1_PARCT|nr:poly [Paramuricea clavata]